MLTRAIDVRWRSSLIANWESKCDTKVLKQFMEKAEGK